jgi:hypothetical protein
MRVAARALVNPLAAAHPEANDGGMSDEENEEHRSKLSDLGDTGHLFDQTNGVVDGLDGDADSPEQVDKRAASGDGPAVLQVPGTHLPGTDVPTRDDADPDSDS